MKNNKKVFAAALCAAVAADLALLAWLVAVPLAQKLGGGTSTIILVELCGAANEGIICLFGCLAIKYKRLWKAARTQAAE